MTLLHRLQSLIYPLIYCSRLVHGADTIGQHSVKPLVDKLNTNSKVTSGYFYTMSLQVIVALVLLIMGSASNVVFAATCNSSGLTKSEYQQWPFSEIRSGNSSTVRSTIPVNASTATKDDDFTINGAFTNSRKASSSIKGTGINITNGSFQVDQSAVGSNNFSTIEFEFTKPLTDLNISIYDIDNGSGYVDKLQFTGVTQFNQNIDPATITTYSTKVTKSSNNTVVAATDAKTDGQYNDERRASAKFDQPVKKIIIKYYNSDSRGNGFQTIDVRFDSFCLLPPLSITKDNNENGKEVNLVRAQSLTTYSVQVKNTSTKTLTLPRLIDPAVTGLSKQSNITCDSSVTNNVCNSNSLPSVTQLESGYVIPNLAAGQVYAIKVPTLVTATSGRVTNTATVSQASIPSQSASDIDTVISIFDTGSTIKPAACPAGHRRFEINNTSSSLPSLTEWRTATTSRTFQFRDTKDTIEFNISFSNIMDKNNANSPYYGSDRGGITNALYMDHKSTANKVNHIIDITINKPVSQAGFVIQDLDAQYSNKGASYIEQADVSTSNGILTYNPNYHNINSENNIVTAKEDKNCGRQGCNINAYWRYKSANTPMRLTHSNEAGRNAGNGTAHQVGYSDFYFCLAPPKLIVKKVLTGDRFDTKDQFKIDIKEGNSSTPLKSFTTEGTNDTFVTGKDRSELLQLEPGTTYNISESVVQGGTNSNYTSSYSCNNSTASSSSTMPRGTGSSFSLSNLSYGDEIVCTFTNTPKELHIKGIVFNDIGAAQPHPDSSITSKGITFANVNLSSIDTNRPTVTNTDYFNGQFDDSYPEPGIANSQIRLYAGSCSSDYSANPINIAGNATVVNTGNNGRYNIEVSSAIRQQAARFNGQLCLEQTNAKGYTVDTTENKVTVDLHQLTADSSFNFGDVTPQYQPLVLRKYQYVHDCSNVSASLYDTPKSRDSKTGFTINPILEVDPKQCIAYYILAFNRGNLPLTDIIITDDGIVSSGSSSYLYAPAPLAKHGNDQLKTNKSNNNVIGTAQRDNPDIYNSTHQASNISTTRLAILDKHESLKLWFNTVFNKTS